MDLLQQLIEIAGASWVGSGIVAIMAFYFFRKNSCRVESCKTLRKEESKILLGGMLNVLDAFEAVLMVMKKNGANGDTDELILTIRRLRKGVTDFLTEQTAANRE